jgi:hypothetical protein
MAIREEMPTLARHEGEWTGVYTHVDVEGQMLDQHDSHVQCTFPANGSSDYLQFNRYVWADGRVEEHRFEATFRDGKIWFDTERILGYAWDVDSLTMILTWRYKKDPDTYLYEMIQISPDGAHRARTWHWFQHGELVKRTLIKERRLR